MYEDWPHFPVVVRWVMFGKTNPQVCHGCFPENMGRIIFGSTLNPIVAHIHGFWSFLAHSIVFNNTWSGIVSLYWYWWLGVYHFLQGGGDSLCFLTIVEKTPNFWFWGWSHYIFNYVGYGVHCSVFIYRVFDILGYHK